MDKFYSAALGTLGGLLAVDIGMRLYQKYSDTKPKSKADPAVSAVIEHEARSCREAALELMSTSVAERNDALKAIAEALVAHAEEIVEANKKDLEASKGKIPPSSYSRLKLDSSKLKGAVKGVLNVANLADPIGSISLRRELDAGLNLKRIACPLGVLGVIFESRPDAFIQIASLAIKSGNGVILKGGKESINSCRILFKVITEALATTTVSPNAVRLLTTRDEIKQLLSLDKYVNLIIPRGSNKFVRYVQDNTRIPVLGHADGICHMYIDDAVVDVAYAIKMMIDAKCQYPAACNAIETLLVNADVAKAFLPQAVQALQDNKVEVVVDERCARILAASDDGVKADGDATEADWRTEYSALKLSVKIVDSMFDAIKHINAYGSKHTDVIITPDEKAAATFITRVDAANVYHNASSRFADGFRYGFGAEVGISTQQLPPRGPVGLEGLVTYKYVLEGDGHIVQDYSGDNAKEFTHRDF